MEEQHAPFVERQFDVGAVEISYAEGPPNGPPFVLLHGGSGSWAYGRNLLDLLADRWRCFAPDLRGHGRSGHTPGHYLLRDYVPDLIALLQCVVREPAVVFGHSLGGEIALMTAAQRPDLFRALVVGDAPVSRDTHPTGQDAAHRAMIVGWRRLAGRSTTEIQAALREMPISVPGRSDPLPAEVAFGTDSGWFSFQAENLHRLDPDMLEAVIAGPAVMLDGYEPERLLAAISCPVLLLQADPAAGGMLRDDEVARALRLLPRGAYLRLDGIGHELYGRHPDRIAAALSPFLAALKGIA